MCVMLCLSSGTRRPNLHDYSPTATNANLVLKHITHRSNLGQPQR